MPYCPSCREEFRKGVTWCPDCDVELVAQLPPRRPGRRAPGAAPQVSDPDAPPGMRLLTTAPAAIAAQLWVGMLQANGVFALNQLERIYVRAADFSRASKLLSQVSAPQDEDETAAAARRHRRRYWY